MQMPGRSFSSGSKYRYGFNGKELDKEIAGTTTYDYGFRIYNPALGRFLSVDPLTKGFPMLTPYQYASNTPIAAVDIDGLEAEIVVDRQSKQVNVNIKLSITDIEIAVLKSVGMTTDNIQAKFNEIYVPNADGNTTTTTSALNLSKKTREELQTALGGKIASGGDGYFNLDVGAEGTYKVFFNLAIDKNLDSKKDITVSKLNIQNDPTARKADITDWQKIDSYVSPNTNNEIGRENKGRQIAHEIGHKMGLLDFMFAPEERPFNSPGLQITYTNENGGTSVGLIKELMEQAGGIKLLSLESLKKVVLPSINLANQQKPKFTKVTTVTGNANVYSDNTKPSGKRTVRPAPTVLKKQK